MGEWGAERAARERVALVIAAVALVITVGYLALEPALQERRRLAREIPKLRQDLAWMRGHVNEIRRLQAQSGSAAEPGAGSLTPAVVESSLRGAGLAEKLEGLRPEGNGVRLVFERIAFGKLLDWLRSFQRQTGAVARGAQVERIPDAPGQVKARLTLAPRGEGQ